MSSSSAASPRSPTARVPRSSSSRVEAFGLSHPGRVRTTNEDAYAVVPSIGLFVVADGVGGHAAGEVASRLAVDSIVAFFADIASGRPGPGEPAETAWHAGFAASLFARAVEEANAVVHAAASCDRAMRGMASTFTGLLLLDDRAVIAHVGDSRGYLLHGRTLRQLTEDHTLAAALMQAGLLTAEEAKTSDARGVIARAIGSEELVRVDTRVVAVEPGDTLLLASDGLHNVLADDDIARVLLTEPCLAQAAEKLVARANHCGGPDNITVVLVRAPTDAPAGRTAA